MTALSVTVVVATYGSAQWRLLADSRAVPSAVALGVPVVQHHGIALHEARNAGLAQVETEWVCFLDADDELERGYFEAMAKATADVRAPAVRYVRTVPTGPPRMPRVAGHTHACAADCLMAGNWLIVGSVVRTELLRQVGGWADFPVYEDWDTWLRCHLSGATFEAVPGAIYRAYVRRDSRNRGQTHAAKMDAHRAIEAINGLPVTV